MDTNLASRELLEWYVAAGVDEAVGEAPVNRFSAPQAPEPAPAPPPPSVPRAAAPQVPPPPATDAAVQDAVSLARDAKTLDELRERIDSFEGCALKKTATKTVVFDGAPDAKALFVGEAPGAEEDRSGLPFVGPAGKLLDSMLESIGLDRTKVLITNTVFWRPPGNRSPTIQEAAVCMPFVERLVEIVDPELMVTLGGAASKALLAQSEGIGRLRGRWFEYATPGLPRPVRTIAMLHPAYLLRSPAQKREAWRDMLALKKQIDELSP